jgi:hypothetical protein
VGLVTGHCPLNKHLHNLGLIDEPIGIACGEDESAFHLLCDCPSLISLRMRKPNLGVEEYEEVPASATAAICTGKRHIHCDSLIHSFLWTFLFFLYCLIQSGCLFISALIFRFFICVVHIKPDLFLQLPFYCSMYSFFGNPFGNSFLKLQIHIMTIPCQFDQTMSPCSRLWAPILESFIYFLGGFGVIPCWFDNTLSHDLF